MRTIAIVAATLLASVAAVADEGELSLGAAAGVDAAWLRHPLAPPSLLPSSNDPVVPLPRLAVHAGFGLTNEFTVNAGLAMGATADVMTTDVAVGGAKANLITGTYAEVVMPVGVLWRLDTGLPVGADAGIDLGPAFEGYLRSVAVDRGLTDHAGRPIQLPLTVPDAIAAGAEMRASAGIDGRLGGLSGALRVTAGLAYFGALSLRIGVVLAVHLADDFGPK